MEWLSKEMFILWGPAAIGWIMFIWERRDAQTERRESKKELLQIIEGYHTSTDAMERVLATAVDALRGSKR